LIILATATTPLLIIICCFVRCCYRKHRLANRPIETEQDTLERDGLVHFNAFLKICDKAGKKLGAGEIGEIYMKFEFGFLRCYNDLPEAMRNTMDDEGYYRTGDIGYMKKGVVYILDKNRYISDRRNSNVSIQLCSLNSKFLTLDSFLDTLLTILIIQLSKSIVN